MGDLFGKSTRGSRLKSADRIIGNLPFVTAGEKDEGISAYIGNDVTIFSKNTITIDMFGSAKYRSYKYGGDDHVAVVHTENLPKLAAMFVTSAIHKASHAGQFDYSRNFYAKDADALSISLPTKNGDIDYDFMKSFIAELEADRIAELEVERIAELEAYLSTTGLKDYHLTGEEQQALAALDSVEWGEFKVGELFEIKTSAKRFDANKVTVLENGNHPYIVRSGSNNGLKGFINEDETYLNEGNTISFGQDTATMFYQEKPYFTGDKIKVLKPKTKRFRKKNNQFFIATMTKSFSSFSWGSSSFNVHVIKNQELTLPTKNGDIDYDFMESFISAIQKLVIKDVVAYADKKIAAHHDVVAASNS